MTYGTVQANAIQGSINTFSPNSAVFRNRIINGAMVIDQRNAGATITPANQAYTLDRWSAFTNGAGVYTVGQSSTAPAGFKNSLLCTVTTVDSSVSGSDYYMLQHKIEGYNVGDLAWGSSDAKTVTLSFWVRSSITGTYAIKLGNADSDRSYVSTYTINSANTFEYKTITITGDTSGTWASTNGVGIEIRFGLALGSTWTTSTIGAWQAGNYFGATTASNNWIGTNGATFYITGVQLEVGSTATSFDYRPYGTELALCQRYFQQIKSVSTDSWMMLGATSSATGGQVIYNYVVPPRTPATGISVSSAGDFGGVTPGNSNATCTAITFASAGNTNVQINFTCPAATFSASVPQSAFLYRVVTGGYIQLTGMEL